MKKILVVFSLMLLAMNSLWAQASKLVGTWSLIEEPDVIIDIRKDGSLSVKEGYKADEGKWVYEETAKKLQFSSTDRDDMMTFTVISVSGNQLKLKDEDRDRELVFTKTKSKGNLEGVEKKILGKWEMKGVPVSFELRKDGSTTMSEKGQDIAGTWVYKPETKKLEITPNDGAAIEFIVKSVSSTTLTMDEEHGNGVPIIFVRASADKKVNTSTLTKNIVGEWTAYAGNRGIEVEVIPEEERIKFQLNIKADGTLLLTEHGREENLKWEISQDGKMLVLSSEESVEIESNSISMPNKNSFVLGIENGNGYLLLLRNGSPEPKDVNSLLKIDKNKMKEPETPTEKPSSHPNYNKMVGTWQIVQVGEENTEAENLSLVFEKNGKLTSNTETEPNKKGKWKMDEAGTYIQISEDYGYDYYGNPLQILEVSDNSIRVLDSDGVEMRLKRKE